VAKGALDPDPASPALSHGLAVQLYLARKFDRAIEQAHDTLEMDTNFAISYAVLGEVYLSKGMHLKDAREFTRRAIDNGQRAGEKDAPALYFGTSALREAWFCNTDEARRRASSALKLSSSRDLLYLVALAFAYAKEDARAKALADDLAKSFPEDTIVQFNYLPSVRGKLALNKGDASAAIEILGPAAPYELGATRATDMDWTAMFPVFVRGEAYLALRQGSKAAAEFQKILDHRGLVLNQPIGALAHLGLGRAYVLPGDIPKAKAAYQDFLTLWKDADLDIPVLQQTKADYAKLQ